MSGHKLEIKNLEIRPDGADLALASDWQKLVSENPHSGFMQSLDWGRLRPNRASRTNIWGCLKTASLSEAASFILWPTKRAAPSS